MSLTFGASLLLLNRLIQQQVLRCVVLSSHVQCGYGQLPAGQVIQELLVIHLLYQEWLCGVGLHSLLHCSSGRHSYVNTFPGQQAKGCATFGLCGQSIWWN